MITILEVEQNSEQWLEERKKYATGSNADILLTQGVDEAIRRNLDNFNGNFYTRRGHILEDEAIEVYNSVHSCIVQRVGMVINDQYPNAACSPDGIDDIYLIEVKAFAEKKHLEIKTLKDIPFKIMSQIQFNMMICDLKVGKLVMYNPDCEDPKQCYREIIVKAKPDIQKNFKIKLGGSHA
jgi:hypothetical protein